jgi:hypothetical protein
VLTKIIILAYLVYLHYPVLEIESKVIVSVTFTLMTPILAYLFLDYKGTCESTFQIEIPKAAPGIHLLKQKAAGSTKSMKGHGGGRYKLTKTNL